jgi:hypothetical protein
MWLRVPIASATVHNHFRSASSDIKPPEKQLAERAAEREKAKLFIACDIP